MAPLIARRLLISLVGLFLGLSTQAQAAQYRVIDIGTLGGNTSTANDVSNAGVVVGAAATATGDLHAYRFDLVTHMKTDLGTLGGASSVANGVNEQGDVVGRSMTASDAMRAFVWRKSTAAMTQLGTLGGTNCSAIALSLSWAVGWCETASGDPHAVLFQLSTGAATDLGTLGGFTSAAYGISDTLQVVGFADTKFGTTHAVRWDCSKLTCPITDLGSGQGNNSAAYGITRTNIVYGTVDSPYGSINGGVTTTSSTSSIWYQAAAWDAEASTVIYGGNRTGQYVGFGQSSGAPYAMLLNANGTKTNLNSAVPAASGWSLTVANDVNDAGVIIGEGMTGGAEHGYVLALESAPQVLSIAPASGATTGGTPVTIAGLNFTSGATVTIGGVAASNVSFVNASTISASTPAHAAGATDVVVRNPNAQTGTLLSGFGYVAITTCSYSLSATAVSLPATGGTGSITVTPSATSCAWTAAANAGFISVTTGASGIGSGTVSYSVAPNTGPGRSGTITLAGLTISVQQVSATNDPAFGSLDTPINNSTGLSGSIAVTGWALDDSEVVEVQVWRDPHPSDPAGAVFDGPAPQGGKVFVGYAALVSGARPDVETLYPNFPFKSRAGWGYLLLTRGLIWDGKGPFKLYGIGKDREGHLSQLGSTSLSIDNAPATRPFGAIDTPGQGATASGLYPNTGWVLTPNAGASIPATKVQVAIDGVFLPGTFSMSDRADISGGFSQFTTTGAGRGLFIDTTKYSDGPHTIGWLVTDSGGQADGVGSRFFTVANATSGLRVAAAAPSAVDLDGVALDATAMRASRGWNADAELRFVDADAAGRMLLAGEELDRLEVRLDELGGSAWSGYLRVGGELRALPIGSHLDPRGTFTWQPGVGFVGTYELVFVRANGGVDVARRELRVVLRPGSEGK
jgi:probable HAF family extracellular repeat protein